MIPTLNNIDEPAVGPDRPASQTNPSIMANPTTVQSTTDGVRAERLRRMTMAALGGLALASYIVLVSMDLQHSRERDFQAASHGLDSLARVLERHAMASVEKIDTVLVASRLRVEDALAGNANESARINATLKALLNQINESQSLRVANREGHFIHDASGTLSNATITDRDYFLRNKADSSGRLVISEPLFARITSNWVITLSRRLQDARGEFAGLVQAAVRADHFQDFYTSLALGPAYSVTLIDDKLRMVARFPARPAQLGKPLDSPKLRAMLAEGATEKIYTTASAVDGVERLYAVRKVGDHPLYVLVGRSTENYLAAWHRQLLWSIGGMLALGVVLTGWIVVWLRTYDAARRLARQMTEAYETALESMRHLAEHDLLTDLPNRALLGEHMSSALAETVGEQAEIALLFLDLDHFKDINDTLGHDIGDQLLLQVAQRLRSALDARDTVSRQGGDEFAILLRGYSNHTRIAAIAQRLINCIAPPFEVQGHELLVGASIGIATYPNDGADIGTLLKNADTAMYQAKAAGGGAYQFFTDEMNTRILDRVAMENSLRRALANHEFVLHYQPQVDGENGRLLGVEALIRWRHLELGDIPPARFIPIAEESGLINGIGEWVLSEACRQSREWHDKGLPPLLMAVNLSAVQFRQRDLAEQVSAALKVSGVAPQSLELEITESAFIRDTDRIVGMLGQLKALGIKLSVDDFGTGYSSLGYLKRLPFDKIKIDQSFVRDLPHNEDDIAITEAIIGIARSLKKEVIAEGVEQAEQRDFLLQRGCHMMQGYHFGHPMPAADIEALIRQPTTANR